MPSHLLAALPYWKFGPWPEEPFMLGPVPLQIHSFGLLVALGLLIGISWLSWRAERKEGLDGERVQNFSLFLVLVGWPLSHVFNVIFYEPQVLLEDPLELFKIWGSISSYGGLFGGLIGFAIWTARNRDVPRATWGEIGTMGLVIPWFFGRLGCASVHDHPGALAPDWFLALEFPRTALLPAGPRHDLGFYEAIWWGVILITMLALDRKPRRRGFYMALIPLMYAPARFAFDFLRVPVDLGGDARYAGLTPAQYFSVALFALGLYMAYRASKNPVVQWRAYEPPKSDEGKQAVVVLEDDDEAAPTTTTAVADASPIVKDDDSALP